MKDTSTSTQPPVDVEKLLKELDETYHSISLIITELEQKYNIKCLELNKKIELLHVELIETYRSVTELTNELESVNEALQASRNFLQIVIDAIPEYTMVIDRNYRVLLANRSVRDLVSDDPVEKGMKCFQLTHANNKPCQSVDEPCPLNQVIESKKPVTVIHTHVNNKGGKCLVEIEAAPIFGENGEVIQIIESGRDITERKKAELELKKYRDHLEDQVKVRTEELQDTNRQLQEEIAVRTRAEKEMKIHAALLEEANKELESFSYSVSHDLRAPLRAIDGFSNVLLNDYGDCLDDEGKRFLKIISNSTQRMGKLVDDLLMFTRLGRLGMKFSFIHVGTLMRDVFRELKVMNPERRITLKMEELPIAQGDRDMVRQVIVNLLSNAFKFTEKKEKALIEVTGRKGKQENVYSIKDNGAGFDMKYANKLFGVFQRLHTSDEFEGTGVGLALVQRIVQRHGGKVWADGQLGKGAVFYFTLPSRLILEKKKDKSQ